MNQLMPTTPEERGAQPDILICWKRLEKENISVVA